MLDVKKRIEELITMLNEAAFAYYQEDKEIMPNIEYDKLYDELVELEETSGIVLSNSPTINVGYEVLSDLPKEAHSAPMLSLNKTKEIDDLASFLEPSDGILSWKLDGLTIVLTYKEGILEKAVTRGNGEIGEVITNNARVFDNIPLTLPFKETLVVRGEAVIYYSDFDKINQGLEPEDQYKNPRNLCSGTVRQLNNEVTASRHVKFLAFSIIEMTNETFAYKHEQLEKLDALGFSVVDYQAVSSDNIPHYVQVFQTQINSNDFASDGLVLTYDDIEFSASLGRTSKFPKDAIAFKWEDEIKDTNLIDIEWSASRTGLINPVAIFEPIELEGTTVARASLHNLSIIEGLELGLGDEIGVYKANMIIPQVAYNNTKSNTLEIPTVCPVCSEATEIAELKDVKTLMCVNNQCPAKKVKSLAHFASRDAMNIDGMSEATLEKFVEEGIVSKFVDLFKLEDHQETIVNMEGFGEKSYTKLIEATEKSKTVQMPNFIYGLGINHIGLSNAKVLTKAFSYDLDQLMAADEETLVNVNTIGDIIAKSCMDYFSHQEYKEQITELVDVLDILKPEVSTNQQSLEGKVFVITGSLNHYDNRKAMQAVIEDLGGKVTGSVTKKTNYLINNDLLSNSSKNKKAKELGVEIISEDMFRDMI